MAGVSNRLSAEDAAFLYLEEPTLPMHVGSVMVFDPPKEGFDYDQFVQVISDRIAGRRRYRQRVRHVPGRIANPVWVDDPQFDLSYHVRRSALPVPGDQDQLEEFVARILSRPLDRDRPLWEAYFVEGVEDGRFAVVTKAHQSMVDGIEAVDIAALILDPEAVAGEDPGEYAPSDLRLVADAVMSSVLSPRTALGTLRTGLRDVTDTGRRVAETAGQVVATLAKVGASPAPDSPLNQPVGSARRFVVLKTDLEDYRSIRTRLTRGRYVEDVTINDVVLATISGGLRTWMQTRGLPVTSTTTVRVMVPVSIKGDDGDAAGGTTLRACFVDLPVGETNPSMRLHQIAFAMRQQMESAAIEGVDAASLSSMNGFAPPTLHSFGARLGSAMTRRLFNLVITNVPGPQQTLSVEGSRMASTYPVMPLGRGQALAIGMTSYDGKVFYGLTADRDAMPDLDTLAQAIYDSLDELRTAHRSGRRS